MFISSSCSEECSVGLAWEVAGCDSLPVQCVCVRSLSPLTGDTSSSMWQCDQSAVRYPSSLFSHPPPPSPPLPSPPLPSPSHLLQIRQGLFAIGGASFEAFSGTFHPPVTGYYQLWAIVHLTVTSVDPLGSIGQVTVSICILGQCRSRTRA